MTCKQIYEAVTIELNKLHAPILKLQEFNYFCNQAINLFVNKIYNIYDINQQTTDDLRVLKSTANLTPVKNQNLTGNKAVDYIASNNYYIEMPDDYLHLLNCVCLFKTSNNCQEDYVIKGATKLTSDNWAHIMEDIYNRPSKKQPYYYINNRNDNNFNEEKFSTSLPTNSVIDKPESFRRTFDFDGVSYDQKPVGSRYSNASKVKIEIYCGKTNDLEVVQVDYIKSPLVVELTQEQLDSIEDISQIMEFPEYVNQEIINELVNLIMRRNNDSSLAPHMLITLSIARPTGQLQ